MVVEIKGQLLEYYLKGEKKKKRFLRDIILVSKSVVDKFIKEFFKQSQQTQEVMM